MAPSSAWAVAAPAPSGPPPGPEAEEAEAHQRQANFGVLDVSDWWSGVVKLRPLWLFMATCVVYALYFYIAEVATLNVGDAPTRDAINTYRRSQPALQAHHEDHFVADAATLSSAVRWGGRSARLSPHTVLSVGDASYDGGVDFIWEVFRPTSCAPTSARRTELRGARQVEIPAYAHGCVASGNCVLQVSAPGLGALSYGVPMYSLEQAPGAVDGRVRLQRLTQVRATVSYSTTLREVGSEWRLDSAEGVYETVLADAAYEEAAAAGSTRTVTVTLTDGAGPQRLTYPALTGGWRLVGLLVSASISGLCLFTLPPFFLLMLTHIMENNGLPPFCWRGRLSFRGW